MKNRSYILLGLVLMGMISRLIPHWPNFTAIGAVALFAGSMYKNKFAGFIIPLVALYLSDLFINNVVYADMVEGFTWFTTGFYFIYIGFILTALLGMFVVNAKKPGSIIAAGLASSILFYLITNYGSWITNVALYTRDFSGLTHSYIAGLPFLANQILGTLVYSAVLFGAAHFALPSYSLNLKLAK